MSTVITTEKPSVAQEYVKVLQVNRSGKTNGYVEGYSPVLKDNVIITWAVGHLITLARPQVQNPQWDVKWEELKPYLPMIPKQFKYVVIPDVQDQFNVVKSCYLRDDISRIYYAGDSGREGIYIQALIRNNIFSGKPSIDERVVWIDSFTEESILNGIKTAKPYDNYKPMINAGYTRAIIDWLIGMNFTTALTLATGERATMYTGRVKNPTLALVVKRQEEIDNFKKVYYYGIEADKGIYWKAVEGTRFYMKDMSESPYLYNENGFRKKEHAEKLIEQFSKVMKLIVENVKVTEKKEYAPYLFNLADLQAYCTKNYKISPAQTLTIAQTLYEKKYTTYPRTDARFLSTAVANDYKTRFGYDVPKRYVDDSKITDHYAIIPTFEGKAEDLSGLEKDVYLAIVKRFMDTMKPPYIYDSVSITYRHASKECFFETFKKVKQRGWKEGMKEEGREDEPESMKTVPNVNDVYNVGEFHLRELETKPPVPYTTGSLILAMEKAGKLIEDEELREQIKTCGIGTSATRANIIEELINKDKYITCDKNQKLAPTELGKYAVKVSGSFDETLISPIKTADMEGKLNAIAEGMLDHKAYLGEFIKYLYVTTKNMLTGDKPLPEAPASIGEKKESKVYKCPKCNGVVLMGKYGWYCKDKCGFYPQQKVYGKDLTNAQVEKLLSGKTIEVKEKNYKIEPKVAEQEYNGKKYLNWVVSPIKATPANSASNNTAVTEEFHCPKCNGLVGKGNYGWYCKDKCGASISKVFGMDLSDTQVMQLLSGKEIKMASKNCIVEPKMVESQYKGKTYYNWSTRKA